MFVFMFVLSSDELEVNILEVEFGKDKLIINTPRAFFSNISSKMT